MSGETPLKTQGSARQSRRAAAVMNMLQFQ
jgi:hypothetical protein